MLCLPFRFKVSESLPGGANALSKVFSRTEVRFENLSRASHPPGRLAASACSGGRQTAGTTNSQKATALAAATFKESTWWYMGIFTV